MDVTNTQGWYEWAFALDDPTLEEIDLSFLLDAPAGKHGFLTVGEDGHFRFQDGTRARFFGTNVGGNSCMPDKKTAEIVAQRLARYGVNLLRLHTPDSTWAGLIDNKQSTSREFVAEALDRYDYFVAQLKQRGIYVYFDLLDYRQFKEGDGVKDAAQMETRWSNSLKGASIFDRRMIELQKEFATKLLTHKNPHTGLRYVDEPALAVQEITNENSLFCVHNTGLMLPSYREDLRQLWNKWLVGRHGDAAALARAWTNSAGACALLPGEDPARGNLPLPAQFLYADTRSAAYAGEKSPARLNTMTRFLFETQTAYYDEMVKHLRDLGLKCPITGTNQDFSNAGNLANARCDFMARNNYWCHPNVHVTPMRFSNEPMVKSPIARKANPIANIASSAVAGKPMIIPEINFPWPNEWRAECLPLMAAYGRLQDWDGLLYFSYHPSRTALHNFNNQSDPVRWGQVPLAALIFLRGDVSAARNTVHVGISTVDTFAARPQRTGDRYSPYRVLPFISKVRNVYFDEKYSGDAAGAPADVVVASGHSATGDYSAAPRAIVFADAPHVDETAKVTDRGFSARQTAPGLKTRPGAGEWDTEIVPDSAPRGAEVIVRDGRPVGFANERLVVFPCASAEETARGDAWLHRLYLDAANRWQLPSAAPLEEAGEVFRSDTGELTLDRKRGVFTAAAANACMATGFLGEAGEIAAGALTVKCQTRFASISVVSLDGRPLAQSGRMLLTVVARSENTGQGYYGPEAAKAPAGKQAVAVDADTGGALRNDRNQLAQAGKEPVLAEPVDAMVSIAADRGIRAFTLTPKGQRQSPLPSERKGGKVILQTQAARSPWILLTAE